MLIAGESARSANMPEDKDIGDVDRSDPAALSLPSREWVAARIAYIIIIIFAILMFLAVFAALFLDDCRDRKGFEAMNLLGHIFGPLLGVILAFYFAIELRSK